jgi:hypothetical protein
MEKSLSSSNASFTAILDLLPLPLQSPISLRKLRVRASHQTTNYLFKSMREATVAGGIKILMDTTKSDFTFHLRNVNPC